MFLKIMHSFIVQILNSFNPKLQVKYTEFAIKNKLKNVELLERL